MNYPRLCKVICQRGTLTCLHLPMVAWSLGILWGQKPCLPQVSIQRLWFLMMISCKQVTTLLMYISFHGISNALAASTISPSTLYPSVIEATSTNTVLPTTEKSTVTIQPSSHVGIFGNSHSQMSLPSSSYATSHWSTIYLVVDHCYQLQWVAFLSHSLHSHYNMKISCHLCIPKFTREESSETETFFDWLEHLRLWPDWQAWLNMPNWLTSQPT